MEISLFDYILFTGQKEKTPLAMLTNAELLEELLLTVQSEPRAQKNAAKLGDASMVNFVDDDWRTNEFDLTPKQQRFLRYGQGSF